MNLETFFASHKRLTRSFKKFVMDYEAQLSFATFEAFLENLSLELRSISEVFLNLKTGAERARKLHSLVEAEIEEGKNIQVSCEKGCSACCNMEIEITSYEADLLHELVQNGHSIDYKRLEIQSQRSVQDPTWARGLRNENNKCVFLDETGSCSIYESRPVMCRRHSVTSPAKNCDTLDSTIVLRYFPKVDLLISGANEDPQLEIGPLAKMLQLRLQQS